MADENSTICKAEQDRAEMSMIRWMYIYFERMKENTAQLTAIGTTQTGD